MYAFLSAISRRNMECRLSFPAAVLVTDFFKNTQNREVSRRLRKSNGVSKTGQGLFGRLCN